MGKKILFVAQSLKVGGVERALVEQVNELSQTEDVTLFLFARTGEYLTELKEEVNLICGNWILNCIGRTRRESRINPFVYFIRNGCAYWVKMFGMKPIYKFLFTFTKRFIGYDIAISYVNDQSKYSLYGGCNQFVINNVSAKKKIAWIHSDPRRLEQDCLSDYAKFDLIVNVSQTMKSEFDKLKIVPNEKSVCVYNRLNVEDIVAKSNIANPYGNQGLKILTVGRLEELKGTKDLLMIAKRLVDDNIDFTWYFLGDGVLYSFCEEYIHKNRMKRNVVLLGKKNNPYPYIAHADVCVSGSQTETFGISIIEALLLKTPVIALKYSAIDEVLDSSNGIVCQSYDDIYHTLRELGGDFNSQGILLPPKLLIDYNNLNNVQINKILK